MSPDVILEVDHIKPVAEGGTNDMLNLITSCRDCNRGKGKTRISDDTALRKQKEQLAELAEKREQLQMLIEWREELSNMHEEEIDYLCDYWYRVNGKYHLTDSGRARMKNYLKRFTLSEILDAIDIAIDKYYFCGNRTESFAIELALDKVGGICYNRRKMQEEEDGDL